MDASDILNQAGKETTSGGLLGLQGQAQSALSGEQGAAEKAKAAIATKQAQGEAYLTGTYNQQADAAKAQRDADTQRYEAFMPTRQNGSDLLKMFAGLATLGFMSGGRGRDSGLAAMKNMTGALQGAQQGLTDRYNSELKEYEKNFAALKAHNEQVDKAYREALETFGRNRDEGLAKLRVAIAQDGENSVIPHMIKAGDIQSAMKVLDSRRKSVEQQETKAKEMQERFAEQKLMLQIKQGMESQSPKNITPEQVDFYVQQAAMGDNSWRTGLGRTKEGVSLIMAVDRRIPQWAAEHGMTPADFGTNKAAYAAKASALKKRQDYVAAVDNLSRQVDGAAQMVEQMLTTGPKDAGLRIINKWLQAGRTATNDPNVAQFNMLMQDLGRQHQRMVTAAQSAGQLHVASQETADKIFNTSNSPQEIAALIKQLRQEAARDKQAGADSMRELQDEMRNLSKKPEPAASSSTPIGQPYADPDKERRYQEWKKANGYQ